MKYPMFYNIEAFALFQKLQDGIKGKIVNGINNSYKNEGIQIHYTNRSFEALFSSISYKTNAVGVGDYFKNVTIEQRDVQPYVLEGLFVNNQSSHTLKASIYAIKSKGFTNTYSGYFKMIIPVNKNFDFYYTIEESKYSSDRVSVSRQGTKLNLYGEEIFAIIDTDSKNQSYLIIESRQKQQFNQFSNKTHIIRIALGFLTGYYAGNEGCYFSYSNRKMKNIKGFKYKSLRKEMKGLTQPVYTNPLGWVRNRKIANKYYKQNILKEVSIKSLSCLCEKLTHSDELSSTLLLLLESNVSSLIIRPRAYVIALEILADIIVLNSKERFAPITSKKESSKFRKELLEVLQKYSANEYFKDLQTLQGRIDQINQMTNKEKLKAPFKVLDIELSEEDLTVINSRNDFLHGRVPDFMKLGNSRTIEQKDRDLYYASVRLNTLLSMLILKFVGFDGYVVNYTKVYEKNAGYICNEDYYRHV